MAEVNGKIKAPFGFPDVKTFVPGAAVVLTAEQQLSYFTGTVAMAADMTVDIATDGQLEPGARVVMRAASDGTARTVTPTNRAIGVAQAGGINQTFLYEFELLPTRQWALINARRIV
jgi:hypothetical protein